MARRGVSLVMLALGAALGVAAFAMPGANARQSAIREGGTFHVALHFIDSMDPALAYSPTSWALLDATCAKLMNYPDRRWPDGLRPVREVAASHRTSKDGKTYTFTLRRGFRFSNGARLDAQSFARQITRILELSRILAPKPDDPKPFGLQYVQDIVGADDVLAGRASRPAGVVSRGRGRTLVIRLTRPIPDFVARLAMPFFCAVPAGLPANPEGARDYASAGPYYVDEYLRGRRVVLLRNRHYGGERRPHVKRIVVDLTHGPGEIVGEIERGRADWGHLPPFGLAAQLPGLVRKYRVNRSRLFTRPRPQLHYFVLNTEGPLFRNNVRLRQAINFAVNRTQLTAAHGTRSVTPTDQYLPIGFPGFRDARIYPNRPNLERALALARGHRRGGKAVLYTRSESPGVELAQVLKQNLARIGLDVEIEQFPGETLSKKLATRGEPFDIGWPVGWSTDYIDPYAFINVLLHGRSIPEYNWAYFNSPTFNRRMATASRLKGEARLRAYGSLDIALARDAAPWIAYGSANAVTFVSNRLDPRCRILRPNLDLAAVCLKR